MTEWLRCGWPRWFLLRIHGHLPTQEQNDWLINFLYPDTMTVEIRGDQVK